MDSNSLPEGLLVGIGNPLLDISANVGLDLLEKYDLKPDNAIMAEEKHMPLYKELIEKYDAEFIAGGSVQNTLRAIQWILKKPKITTYFGCVGKDDYAKILRERAVAEGVTVLYQETSEAATGTCAVLINGTKRSLCANLAAAQKFTSDHLAKEECQKSIQKAKFFYGSGFFVAVSPESLHTLARQALADGQVFAWNLSAPFVSQFFKDELEKILPYVDILFGNESEAEEFSKAFNFGLTNLQEIAMKISQMPKENKRKPRVVIITQGSDPVILVENGKVSLIPVKKINREKIVDTNGAGDAFTGGFLSQLLLGKPYTACVECGIYAATHVIQQSGCTFGESSNYSA